MAWILKQVAHDTPEQIKTVKINPIAGLQSYQCRLIAYTLGLKGQQHKALELIMRGMVDLFMAKDASQIEINPLIVTGEGELLALDAKINFDDNALPLHPDILALKDPSQEDERENIAQAIRA